MASLMRMFRKSVKRSMNAVRTVGKVTRKTVKRGTNAIGITRRNRRNRK